MTNFNIYLVETRATPRIDGIAAVVIATDPEAARRAVTDVTYPGGYQVTKLGSVTADVVDDLTWTGMVAEPVLIQVDS